MPESLYKIPIGKDIDVNYNDPSSINLKGIKQGINWIRTDDLSDCFGFEDEQRFLVVEGDGELVSAQLVIMFVPTIWSDEEDNVIQLIQLPSLGRIGIKDLAIDFGKVIPLSREVLFSLPENVIKDIASISRQDILAELDSCGSDNAFEDWTSEKRVWQRYTSDYHVGDFVNLKKRVNRFQTYPDMFYLHLTFKKKKGEYIINLCDNIIIGN